MVVVKNMTPCRCPNPGQRRVSAGKLSQAAEKEARESMPHKILIVEDDPAQRRILEELVKRFGFDALSAESASRLT